jgi:hypothetical protein
VYNKSPELQTVIQLLLRVFKAAATAGLAKQRENTLQELEPALQVPRTEPVVIDIVIVT